jgi:integrase
MDFFQNIREPRTLPKYLTEKQQKALVKASRIINHRPQRDNWMRERDYLMIVFFLDTGLRVAGRSARLRFRILIYKPESCG